ncbi:hypothetical protein KCM76_17815 [Zooshikella marina]|uniref:hypothetical protein n=1 Tax=Zooshikella ganghwensis TaxID=202772 RepID=UPI001BAEF17B|nr:hypothetical protein [Zooshikella ganghwensis]MBU2707856.1 hypothetical protein [Zooshikella ganghwensis]
MINIARVLPLLVISFIVTGCVSHQPTVNFSDSFLEKKGKTVGIARTKTIEAETTYTGSIGLLDYGIISAVNSGLDNHLKTLEFPEYTSLQNEIAKLLKEKGLSVIIIEDPIDKEKFKIKTSENGKNTTKFTAIKEKHSLDYILLLDLQKLGTTRSYYGPAPTSDPIATTNILGQMIDLNTGKLEWYRAAKTEVLIDEPWDESESKYPNLTNAVYRSFDNAIQIIKQDFTLEQASNKVTTTKTVN